MNNLKKCSIKLQKLSNEMYLDMRFNRFYWVSVKWPDPNRLADRSYRERLTQAMVAHIGKRHMQRQWK